MQQRRTSTHTERERERAHVRHIERRQRSPGISARKDAHIHGAHTSGSHAKNGKEGQREGRVPFRVFTPTRPSCSSVRQEREREAPKRGKQRTCDASYVATGTQTESKRSLSTRMQAHVRDALERASKSMEGRGQQPSSCQTKTGERESALLPTFLLLLLHRRRHSSLPLSRRALPSLPSTFHFLP